jgi:hypothetical protein
VGAEIEIDGTFVGNTPSTVTVPAGEHVITIKMAGYISFERKVKTSTGKVTISTLWFGEADGGARNVVLTYSTETGRQIMLTSPQRALRAPHYLRRPTHFGVGMN